MKKHNITTVCRLLKNNLSEDHPWDSSVPLPTQSQERLAEEWPETQVSITRDSSLHNLLIPNTSISKHTSEVPTDLSQDKPKETQMPLHTAITSLRTTTGSGEWEPLITFTKSHADWVDLTTDGLELSLGGPLSLSWWSHKLLSGRSTSLSSH